MPKTRGSQTVADATYPPDSRVEVPKEVVKEAGPDQEYLPDGHPNPKAWNIWEFMLELEQKDLWQHYIGYLYRVAPKHAPTDHPAYLVAIVTPITQEFVRQQYGGKKYTLILNRRIGSRQRQVYKEQFDIDAPVIWQDGEVLADGSVPGQPGRRIQQDGTAVNPSGAGKPDSLVTKFVDDLIAQRDRALQAGESFDTGEALQRALALQNKGFESALTSVTSNLGKGNDGGVAVLTPLLTGMMTMMGEVMKAVMARKEDPMVQTLLARALEKPEDPLQKITAMLTLFKELGVKLGSGHAAEAGSEWAGVAEALVNKGPELLANATQLVTQANAARTGTGSVTSVRPASLTTGPAAPGPKVVTMPATVPSGTTVASPAQPVAAPLTEEQCQHIVITRIKQVIVQMLEAGDSGNDAALVAATMHPLFAQDLADKLKANTAELQADPILARGAMHPNVLAFCQEYVSYFEEEKSEPGAEPEA